MKRRKKLGDDPQYLVFIRTLPCVVCAGRAVFERILEETASEYEVHRIQQRQKSSTEAAHVGDRGLGQKCSDREAMPLCGREHHREGPDSHHQAGKEFWNKHGLGREEVLALLWRAYELGR